MDRSTRTAALVVALAVVVALSGCAGLGGGGSPTGTPTAGTDAPTEGSPPTATSAAGSTATPDADSTEVTAGATTDREATGTDRPETDPTATATSTAATEANASARFVDDGETLATVTLEVADNDSERAQGLMYRESLARNHGMVFVYDEPQRLSFWMKNTLVPLDMVFVAANGTVLNVEHADVPPENSTDYGSYTSDGPAQYVVEVNRGFANRTGVGPGTEVEFSGLSGTASDATNATDANATDEAVEGLEATATVGAIEASD